MIGFIETMSTMTRFGIIVFTLVIAQSTLAQEFAQPPAVTGVIVEKAEGGVRVRWNPVSKVPIGYYRVYHSTESILQNDGIYDDFEVTEDAEASLVIVLPKHIKELYATVIAVGTDNLESEYFIEEGYISLTTEAGVKPKPKKGEGESTNDSSAMLQDNILHMLSAEGTSPTEVTLTFSVSPTVDPALAPQNLKITDQNGYVLQIKSLTIYQTVMTITTEPQAKGSVYRVDMGDAFHGKNGEPLDAVDRTFLFTSAGTEDRVPQPPAAEPRDPGTPPDVTNLRMSHQLQEDGSYNVIVEWETDNAPGDLLYHVVYQTRDGGRTFGPPGVLSIDIRGVHIPGVTAGKHGVVVQTVNKFGFTSKGVFEQISLPYYVPGYGFYSADLVGEGVQEDTEREEVPESEKIQVVQMEIPESDVATLLPIDTKSTNIQTLRPAPAAEPRLGVKNLAILVIGSIAALVVIFLGMVVAQKRWK